MCSVLEQQCGLSVHLCIWSPKVMGISGGAAASLLTLPCELFGNQLPASCGEARHLHFWKSLRTVCRIWPLHLSAPHPTLLVCMSDEEGQSCVSIGIVSAITRRGIVHCLA